MHSSIHLETLAPDLMIFQPVGIELFCHGGVGGGGGGGGVALTLVHSKMPFQQHQMNNIDCMTYVKIVRYKDVRYT